MRIRAFRLKLNSLLVALSAGIWLPQVMAYAAPPKQSVPANRQTWVHVPGSCAPGEEGAVFGLGGSGCGGTGTSFDTQRIFGPAVLKGVASPTAPCPGIPDGTTCYRLWYVGTNASGVSRIGLAVSPDGVTWTRVVGSGTGGSVFEAGPAGRFDSSGVTYFSVMRDGDLFKMWYSGYGSALGTSMTEGIGLATSPDGINWTRVVGPLAGGALLRASEEAGSFDQHESYVPFVIKDVVTTQSPCVGIAEGQTCYRMWYEGAITTGGYKFRIGYAVSPDGVNWTRVPGNAGNNAVLANGSASEFDSSSVGIAQVNKEGALYRMWYEAKDFGNRFRIGHVVSLDGIVWQRPIPSVPVFTGANDPGTLDPDDVWSHTIVKDGNSYSMWYTVSTNPQAIRFGLARLTPGSPLSAVHVARSGNEFTLSFTTNASIPAGGSILLTLPASIPFGEVTPIGVSGFSGGASLSAEASAINDAPAANVTRGALVIRLASPQTTGPKTVTFALANPPAVLSSLSIQTYDTIETLEYGSVDLSVIAGPTSTPTDTPAVSATPSSTATATLTQSATPTPGPSLTPTTTATPSLTATPSSVINDDFDRADSTNLGVNWTERGGDWRLSSQAMSNATTATDHVATWNGGAYASVLSSARTQIMGGSGTASIGIRLGGFAGGVPATGYIAELQSSGLVVLWRIDTWAILGTYSIPAYVPGQAVVLALRGAGSTLNVDVNGTTRITATDSQFTTGQVGLWSYAPSAVDQHRFDDFVVQDLSAPTATPVVVATLTPTSTPIATMTATLTATPITAPTSTITPSPTFTATATQTASPVPSLTATATATATPSFSPSPTHTATQTTVPSPAATHTATATVTLTSSPSPTATDTSTATTTISPTPTATATLTSSPSPTASHTATAIVKPTSTPTVTLTSSPSPTATHTATATSTATVVVSATPSATASATRTASPSATATSTASPTPTSSFVGDDFNRADSTALGANWLERSGDFAIVGQTLRNAGVGEDLVATYTGVYTNVTTSAHLQIMGGSGTVGLGARLGGFSGGVPRIGYLAELQSTGTVVLWRISDWHLLGSTYTIPGYTPGQIVILTLRANGSNLSVDVNGTQRIAATDTTVSNGQVGLWSYLPSVPEQHRFDDLRIE